MPGIDVLLDLGLFVGSCELPRQLLAIVGRERVLQNACGAADAPLRVDDCQFALGFESSNLSKNRRSQSGMCPTLAFPPLAGHARSPSETQAGLITSELAKGKVHNYAFTYKPGAKDTCDDKGSWWLFLALPKNPSPQPGVSS
jgi:hypothetical protein